MVEAKSCPVKTLPPHIHASSSLSRQTWGQVAALVPLFVAACFSGHLEILRFLLICLVSAAAFELFAGKIFQKKENLRKGEAVLTAVLFSILLPSKCPSEIVIFGVFLATVVAQEAFGGRGAYLFHPLLLAYVFLQFSFPKVMKEPMLLSGEGNVWTLGAILFGSVLFLKQKKGYWEVPVLFMGVCFLCEAVFGGCGMPMAFFSGVLLTAFFLLADPVAMPLTRKGTLFFVCGVALLGSRISPEGFSIRTTAYAILLMNLFTPWLDVCLKPRSCTKKNAWKATYFL